MHAPRRSVAMLAIVFGLALVSCTDDDPDPSAAETTPPTTAPPVTTASEAVDVSPTPPALPEQRPPTSGPVAADCVNGWETPEAGSGPFTSPLGEISTRRHPGRGVPEARSGRLMGCRC